MKNDIIINFDESPGPGPDESLVKTARLFYVGIHKGRKYSADDLVKILNNFNPESPIPIQLDHSLSARDQVGLLRRIWLVEDGNELMGELEILGRENVERVRLGLWKKVSVGLSIREPEMKLMEVSITPFPALDEACIYSQQKDNTITSVIERNTTNIHMDYPEEIEKMEAERCRLIEKIEHWEQREMVENFIRKGKTTPSMRDVEISFIKTLNDSQRKEFVAVKENQPAFFHLGADYAINPHKPCEKANALARKEADEILQFVSTKGIKFSINDDDGKAVLNERE